MTSQDAETIIAVAAMAAMADGKQDASELAAITDAARRLGLSGTDRAFGNDGAAHATLEQLSAQLTTFEAKLAAYDVAVAVCNASGPANPAEIDFLRALSAALTIDASTADAAFATALTTSAMVANAPLPAAQTGTAAAPDALDNHILDQAMLTAALELLPDRLANIAILPLQLRLVRHIGQSYGQQMDADQVKDLAATFGLGAAAQVMESVVRKAFGSIAGGLLGGLFGSTAGVAAGGAVTFASTYAFGHAAKQYYQQGRSLSTADMKALFARFQGDAGTIYPRVQDRIATMSHGTNLSAVLKTITG